MKYNSGEISKFGDKDLPCWEWQVRQGGLMNKEVAKNNFLDFKKIFDKHNIKFILAFGTLLGAIRQNDFIDWDSDTDVLCFREDYLKIEDAFYELESLGFYIPRTRIPLMDHYLIRNGEKIDINWLIDNGHNELMYADWIKWDKKFFQFPLPTIKFLNENFQINNYINEFLENLYGNDWKTPNKNKKGFK